MSTPKPLPMQENLMSTPIPLLAKDSFDWADEVEDEEQETPKVKGRGKNTFGKGMNAFGDDGWWNRV